MRRLRIGLDMDGTITDGRIIFHPIDTRDYLDLVPYDSDTIRVFNALCEAHDVYIITARRGHGASVVTRQWLVEQGAKQPTGIITQINVPDKPELCAMLDLDFFIDDRPEALALQAVGYGGGVWGSPPTACYLLADPNRPDQADYTGPKLYSWKEIETTIEAIRSRSL